MREIRKVLTGSMIAGAALAVASKNISSKKEKTVGKIVDDLTNRLDKQAVAVSDRTELWSRGSSEHKFLRPDQTLEGQASDYIKGVSEALDEALRRYPDSHPGLVFFATASGINAETPNDVHMAWAKEVMENKEIQS